MHGTATIVGTCLKKKHKYQQTFSSRLQQCPAFLSLLDLHDSSWSGNPNRDKIYVWNIRGQCSNCYRIVQSVYERATVCSKVCMHVVFMRCRTFMECIKYFVGVLSWVIAARFAKIDSINFFIYLNKILLK